MEEGVILELSNLIFSAETTALPEHWVNEEISILTF